MNLHIHRITPPRATRILIVHADKDSKHIAGENWHSDVCDAEPPMGSILHLWEVPKSGGDTLFASMEAAYDDLSERMKIYLDGLNATHSGEQIYRGRYNNQKHDDTNVTYQETFIRSSNTPVTGRKSIFVNKTSPHINEIPKAESDTYLHSYIVTAPNQIIRFALNGNRTALLLG